jgi:hypothetical protein
LRPFSRGSNSSKNIRNRIKSRDHGNFPGAAFVALSKRRPIFSFLLPIQMNFINLNRAFQILKWDKISFNFNELS